jgi:hypothetical protein
MKRAWCHRQQAVITFSTPFASPIPNQRLRKLCGQVPQPLTRESDGSIISGIITAPNNAGFSAYPNPANEIIKFEYDLQGHKMANLQIFNISGQLMKEMMPGQAFDFIQLNISGLEQGTRTARITTEDGFALSEKFVKVDEPLPKLIQLLHEIA